MGRQEGITQPPIKLYSHQPPKQSREKCFLSFNKHFRLVIPQNQLFKCENLELFRYLKETLIILLQQEEKAYCVLILLGSVILLLHTQGTTPKTQARSCLCFYQSVTTNIKQCSPNTVISTSHFMAYYHLSNRVR